MSMHPKQQLMRIRERDRPGSFILVHYNPTEDTEELAVDYEEVEVPGRGLMTLQFKQGRPGRFSAELFLNEWGNNPARQIEDLGVEATIDWLKEKMLPRAGGAEGEPAPPILEVITDRVFVCVLVRLSVRRVNRAPDTWRGPARPMGAIRAYADVEFQQFVESTV